MRIKMFFVGPLLVSLGLSGCGESADELATKMEKAHRLEDNKKIEMAQAEIINASFGHQGNNKATFRELIDGCFEKDWTEVADMATGMGLLSERDLEIERRKTKALITETKERLRKPVHMILDEIERREGNLGQVESHIRSEIANEVFRRFKLVDPNFKQEDVKQFMQESASGNMKF